MRNGFFAACRVGCGVLLVLLVLSQVWPVRALAPANDDFDTAAEVPSLPYRAPLDAAATTAPDDPAGCGFVAHTMWYRYTAPVDGKIALTLPDVPPWEIETATVAVFTGARGSLTRQGCGGGFESLPLSVDVTAGETYHVMVAGFYTEGAFEMTAIDAPANDGLAGALPLDPLPYSATVPLVHATSPADDPQPSCAGPLPLEQTVWYAYTGQWPLPLTISIDSLSTISVAVYQGLPGELTEVGCSEGPSPELTVSTLPNMPYYVLVGGINTPGSVQVNAWTTASGPQPTCPILYTLDTVWEGDLVLSRQPEAQYTFDFDLYTRGLLVVWSAVGHPEAGCPDGSNRLCHLPDQPNEQFSVFLNTVEVGTMSDHGDHNWAQGADAILGILPPQSYTLTVRHTGDPAPDPDSSVFYRIGLCTAGAPQVPPPTTAPPTIEPSVEPPTTEPSTTEPPTTEPPGPDDPAAPPESPEAPPPAVDDPVEPPAEPTEPAVEPPPPPPSSGEPALSCPAGYHMAGSWSGDLRLSGGPEQAQTFTAPGGQAAILVYASKVGHPEVGCPGGDNPLCSMPDQDNEQYHVYLDGSAVAYAPDHGNHAWATLGDVDLGVLSGGTHTLIFRHEGPAGAFPASSVGYKAGVCIAN